MLDYKDIIVKHFGLGMSGRQIARELGVSKSGVNDVLGAFKRCETLDFPLPEGITNYGIAAKIYGGSPNSSGRDVTYACPDFEDIHKQLHGRKNMTLVYLWNRYMKSCEAEGQKGYQYRQFCKQYSRWCETNRDSMHITAVSGQKMEVDFAGKTFQMTDHLTGEILDIVVFVAILPYSQYIYAEGMTSTKEPQWIAVNNHALQYFGGVPAPTDNIGHPQTGGRSRGNTAAGKINMTAQKTEHMTLPKSFCKSHRDVPFHLVNTCWVIVFLQGLEGGNFSAMNYGLNDLSEKIA